LILALLDFFFLIPNELILSLFTKNYTKFLQVAHSSVPQGVLRHRVRQLAHRGGPVQGPNGGCALCPTSGRWQGLKTHQQRLSLRG